MTLTLSKGFWPSGAPASSVEQTNGLETDYTGYNVISWLTSGTITPVGSDLTVDILVVAGGGSGGGNQGSGGGAGGMQTFTSQTLTADTEYTITVGAGGAAPVNDSAYWIGSKGSDSKFGALTSSEGGGYGIARWPDNYITYTGGVGGDGGSGGGASPPGTYTVVNRNNQVGSGSQGNDGGSGLTNHGTSTGGYGYMGGGGGGQGGAGGDANGGSDPNATVLGGSGGIGAQNDYRTGTNQYYAGGGGGSAQGQPYTYASDGTGGSGGNGGGGQGESGDTDNQSSGTANSGGGGGPVNHIPGSGGSGIVVLRYAS